jgi:signal transduction histidine kinase
MAKSQAMSAHPWQANLLRLVSVFVAYFVAGIVGLAAPFTNANVSPIWPPAGVALAAVLIWGNKIWPAIALGAFLVNYLTHMPSSAAIGIAIGNTSSALIAALLLRRIPNFSTSMSRIRDVLALVLCGGLVGTIVAATVGVAALYVAGVEPWATFTTAWLVWLLGDAMGVILITPLILTRHARSETSRLWPEQLIVGLLVAAATLLVFDDRVIGKTTDDVLAFIVFPFVIWAAIRFGPRGVAAASGIIATISVWETATGHGPFVRHGVLQDVGFLQLFLAVISVSGLLFAAAVLEREEAQVALAREQESVKERTRAEQALIRSEKLAATGRIAASIAHEINNPLTAITNLVYLLGAEEQTEKAKAQLEILSKEVDRISHITRQTLGFYRQATKPTYLSIGEVIDDLLDLYLKRLETKNIVVERTYASSGLIEAYRSELQQVFANLILNACDAVEDGGRISIKTEDDRLDRVRIVIADNGVGISEEHRNRIFEPFFTTKHDKGVGIGLSVSQGIVHKHGGEITFSNSALEGLRTEFSIVLSRKLPAQAAG